MTLMSSRQRSSTKMNTSRIAFSPLSVLMAMSQYT